MYNPDEDELQMLLVSQPLLIDLRRQLRLAHDAILPLASGEPISIESQISLAAIAQLAIEQAMRDADTLRPSRIEPTDEETNDNTEPERI